MSVIYFCPEFICCPYYRGVRYSGVSARRELTVLQPSYEKLRTMLMQYFGGQIRCIMGNVESANNTKDNFLWVPERVNFKFDRNCENAGNILFCEIWNIFSQCFSGSHNKLSLVLLQLTNYILWPFKSVKRMQNALNYFSIITLMIIENWALWLVRSFAPSSYNHRAVIITLEASSFQHGSQICWCFRVGNWSI